jgi:hypothetical protein
LIGAVETLSPYRRGFLVKRSIIFLSAATTIQQRARIIIVVLRDPLTPLSLQLILANSVHLVLSHDVSD